MTEDMIPLQMVYLLHNSVKSLSDWLEHRKTSMISPCSNTASFAQVLPISMIKFMNFLFYGAK